MTGILTASNDVNYLDLQLALGKAEKGTDVKVRNIRMDKITDGYTNVLPANFALTNYVWNGTSYTTYTVSDPVIIPLTAFSYDGTDSAYERHDDDCTVHIEESGSSATLIIEKAPETGRGVWKVKLFVETGINLTAGKHHRISTDVKASAETDYEIYNDGAHSQALKPEKQTVT